MILSKEKMFRMRSAPLIQFGLSVQSVAEVERGFLARFVFIAMGERDGG